jgi:putative PIN family toxin of toxin-antitoxin system
MRIVVDTNIIISAILFPNSFVAKIFKYVIDCETLVLNQYIIDEIERVFIEKFSKNIKDLKEFMKNINYEIYKIDAIDYSKYPAMRDEKDLPILALAIESKSDILITGDKDFDDVKIDKPIILSPRKFGENFHNAST